jgi:hypothetical protein
MDFTFGVGQAIGGMANAIGQSVQNNKNRRFQERMADKAYHRQIDMWNMQNQYNTPQAQMQRLEAAGLNKLMPFIGGGSSSGGQAQGFSSAPQASYEGKAPKWGAPLENIYDLRLKKAGADKIVAEAEGIKTDNERKLVTWLEDKKYIDKTQAAKAAAMIAEAGLKEIEYGRELGKDAAARVRSKDQYVDGEYDITAGRQLEVERRETEKKGNALIDANAENVQMANYAKKKLKEFLEKKGNTTSWETIETIIYLILDKK